MSAPSFDSASMKRTITRLRRLCCLGLGSQIAIPALLSELHALIPSYRNQFVWAGPNHEVTNYYIEGDALSAMPLYFTEFHDKREKEVIFTFAETMRRSGISGVMEFREHRLEVGRAHLRKARLVQRVPTSERF